MPAFRQGQEACNSSLAETFGEQALAPVATGSVGPLPGCTESSNRTISADVLVQSPVTDGLKSAGPTSLPSSVPAVETLLSRADGQLTPPSAHVLVQTSVSDRLACPVSTSRKDSDNVPSDVPSRTTSGVHPVELRPGAKWDQRSSFRWSQAKAKVCRERHRVVLGRDQSGVQAVMDYPAPTNAGRTSGGRGLDGGEYQYLGLATGMVPKADGSLYLCTDFHKWGPCVFALF